MKSKNTLIESRQNLFNRRPNILLIVSDDHGYGDLSFLGINDDVHTPNLDRLRASGIYFENGYVTAPICSPSRSGLMVGNYQQRWGAEWFNNSAFAPEEYETIPELLSKANYKSGYFGKVHYGHDELGDRSNPENHGFDESFYGLAGQSSGRLHYMNHSLNPEEEFGLETQYLGMGALYENGEASVNEDHLTIEFTNRAIDFMDSTYEKQPFFTMVAYNAVHNFTWQLPKEELEKRGLPEFPDINLDEVDYIDWYDGVITPNLPNGREYYLAQLELMDQEIGRLLDYLEENQLRENTLVLYITDNGGSPCNYGSNLPLYGTKYSLYEGGIRVPYIMSWPTVIQPNVTKTPLVSSLDFLPTFAYLAGISGNDVRTDGRNLLETLDNNQGHSHLFFDTGFQWSVRDEEWKLRKVTEEKGAEMAELLSEVEHTDIGQPGKSLVHISESYDESMKANQIEEQRSIAEDLEAKYQSWRKEMDNSNK